MPREDDMGISNGSMFHHLIEEKEKQFIMPISMNLG